MLTHEIRENFALYGIQLLLLPSVREAGRIIVLHDFGPVEIFIEASEASPFLVMNVAILSVCVCVMDRHDICFLYS